MKTAVVGGGILGLTLSHRLNRLGHEVHLFEAAGHLGGLACPHDYGSFVWDRFYHCILPQDRHLRALLGELGLADELRWTVTQTGYWARGRRYDMSNNADFLRFPLLSVLSKARLGAAVIWATRFADPDALYTVSARDWLVRICGRKGYEVFWAPLLEAKFGTYHEQVAAVFIYATLTRLMEARSGVASKESFGYVSGGYGRILGRFEEALRQGGVAIHLGAPVQRIERMADGDACRVRFEEEGASIDETFDQVFFTAPNQLARRIVSDDLLPHVEEMERRNPASAVYLGTICCALVLRDALTPYYVLNIGDSTVGLTGLIEMTNLIDRDAETAGRSLVYLPLYLASDDPRFAEDDETLAAHFTAELGKLFPDFQPDQILHRVIHRERFVQPLPLVLDDKPSPAAPTKMARPFQIVNTSLLRCATLNNDEVVALVEKFVETNSEILRGGSQRRWRRVAAR
ncbi:MAG: NAD(P)-binding protein [bacterium]|nr:NAD(P)-binding protein [bacterium]